MKQAIPRPWRNALILLLTLFVGHVALAASAESLPEYRVTLRLDPATRHLQASAHIDVHDPSPFDLVLASALKVHTLRVNGSAVDMPSRDDGHARRWSFPAGPPGRRIDVVWQGTLAPLEREVQHRDTLRMHDGYVDPHGSFLPPSALWYPRLERSGKRIAHTYEIHLDLPAGTRGVVPGSLRKQQDRDGRWHARFDFPHPSVGMTLITGPYELVQREHSSIDGRTITLQTWFHASLAELAPGYLDAVSAHLSRYEKWIGAYPYATFSVVSSPTPTGFGLPTLTYLGIDVLRLPFIRATSLGHEVLHNWWGNGVRTSDEGGNWSEGLTTFMADYTYAMDAGPEAARAMRQGWLRDLAAIPENNYLPLVAFAARDHGAAQAVGYGKAAMVFVMLRDHIGVDAFDRGIRRFWRRHRFESADWDALRAAFEAESGVALEAFFTQWLTRTGLPRIRLERTQKVANDLYATLSQDQPPWALDVPLHLETLPGKCHSACASIKRSKGLRSPSRTPQPASTSTRRRASCAVSHAKRFRPPCASCNSTQIRNCWSSAMTASPRARGGSRHASSKPRHRPLGHRRPQAKRRCC